MEVVESDFSRIPTVVHLLIDARGGLDGQTAEGGRETVEEVCVFAVRTGMPLAARSDDDRFTRSLGDGAFTKGSATMLSLSRERRP